MGAGRDKREVHRGVRMPRKVKSVERCVGRGSGRAGGWLDVRLDMGAWRAACRNCRVESAIVENEI